MRFTLPNHSQKQTVRFRVSMSLQLVVNISSPQPF
jgi:hypothetical protein